MGGRGGESPSLIARESSIIGWTSNELGKNLPPSRLYLSKARARRGVIRKRKARGRFPLCRMAAPNNTSTPKKLIVIYSPPGMPGHLFPAVELGKLLVVQGLEVTVVLGGEHNHGAGGSFLAGIEAASPSLSFHCLPRATLPSDVPAGSFEAQLFGLARASNPDLRDFLRVAFCLYQQVIHEQTALSFRDLGSDLLHVPGLPPIPADHLPAFILDRDSLSSKFFLGVSERLCNSQGLIVNSCRSLEPRATDAIVSGLCTLPGRRTPPLYCIGPLIKPDKAGMQRHECLACLDGQPKASVVFLSFGSLGRFSAEQIKQMAAGLETSGQRQAVLAHGAVGGFVTHCGWNSVLEAVMAGVPMLAWPLYAEQHTNKVFLVEEMRLAVAIEGYDKEMVEAQEVAAKVRWLIESDGGRELRHRTQGAMRQAKEALDDAGESRTAFLHLTRQWKNADHNGSIN
uniref:Anthocyanidin 5,3-O-glucosyltransferase n=1 Tax=Aegilops tauschii TaxID=37682 RepID=M8BP91_AEGTA